MPKKSKVPYLTEQDYLRREEFSPARHEYVDGHVFAMSGATDAHHLICANLFRAIDAHIRGSGCTVYKESMKLHIQSCKAYYYPDIMVSCEPFQADAQFKRKPITLMEVLSHSTASIDRREKLIAYQRIPTVHEYVLVHHNQQRVELYRRQSDNEWEVTVSIIGDDLLLESLPNGPLSLPLSLIYHGYNPPTRVKEGEAPYETGLDEEYAQL